AFALTRSTPPLAALLRVVPFGLAGTVVLSAMSLGIGLLAFWLEDVTPVVWVWQKLVFVLGGLMLPLQIYPDLFQPVAFATPFPAILAGPASFVLPGSHFSAFALARDLAIWSGVISFVIWAMFQRAVKRVTFNGG